MKFSVILANYNGERYLAEAIESVLHQTYSDFEFIIVDDGSTDTSKEIIEKYKSDRRIYFLNQRENQGQANAFNLEIQKAECEIVCFIDSDDVWMSKKLENIEKLAHLSPNCQIYQHNLLVLDQDTMTDKIFCSTMAAGNVYQEALKTRCLPIFSPTSGVSLRYEVIEKIGTLPECFVTCADGYMTRTAMCFFSVASTTESWAFYRIHQSNNTYHQNKKKRREYRYRKLIPELNFFYERHRLALRFPSMQRLFDPPPMIKTVVLDGSNSVAKKKEFKFNPVLLSA